MALPAKGLRHKNDWLSCDFQGMLELQGRHLWERWKGILSLGVRGGVPEKGGIIQLLRGCFSELGDRGRERQRGFSLEVQTWDHSYDAGSGRAVAWVKQTNVRGEGSLPEIPLEQKSLPF